ncbi:MAG: MATE family efflux transporter [Lachnospiraceae bacterium]|nr:MATE family efflux transporter [Lachnospiraceae bacterium]
MSDTVRQENKMGTMPVRRLILTMSLPMMMSMMVQALYNVVDSIFVSRLSEDALTAVTLAFPMQNLMIAVAGGTGVGINALLSRSLGEKRYERADQAAGMGILLNIIHYFIFLLIGLFGAKGFIHSQTDDPEILALGTTYLSLVCILSFGVFVQITMERLLQSTGRTFYSMIAQASGAVCNIIFDPLLIFGIGPFPRMGVAGAACATVFGQVVGSSIAIFMNLRKNKDIRLSWKGILHPAWDAIREIYAVGIPSMLMMAIGSVMTYLMNQILIAFSNTAAAVFGVYFKLQSFVFMPVFGLNNGVIPVLAYNYGARNPDRIRQTLRFSLVLALSIMIAGALVFIFLPVLLLKLFNASPEMIAIGVPALRIIAFSFPVAAVCIVIGSVFQAFSRSMYSLAVSVGRQLVVLIPAAWLLSRTGVLANVWWAFPIAEIMSFAISAFFFRKLYREIIAVL